MTAERLDRNVRFARRSSAAVAACLLLTVCAGAPTQTRWVKAGLDDASTAHEIDDCQARARAAQNNEQGINEDISATLGRNWQMSYTTRLQDQNMRQQATGVGDQVFNNCMRAKGFSKSG